jgi:hypothetical protein
MTAFTAFMFFAPLGAELGGDLPLLRGEESIDLTVHPRPDNGQFGFDRPPLLGQSSDNIFVKGFHRLGLAQLLANLLLLFVQGRDFDA